MTEIADLRFDTIENCHASLRALVTGQDRRHRLRALGLLAGAAPPSLKGPLLAVASDPDIDVLSCTYALRALRRMGEPIPDAVFRALLGEAADALDSDDASRMVNPAEVVHCAITDTLLAQTLAWIEGLPPDAIPKLLARLLCILNAPPPGVYEALVARWVAGLPDPLAENDLRIAHALAYDHPAVLDVLERHWRPRASYADPEFARAVANVPALARRLRDVPSLRASALAELVGPTEALADALGDLDFAHRLRGAVLRWNVHALPPPGESDAAARARYDRALAHLRRWRHGAVVVASLLRETTLAVSVEEELASLWLSLDRDAAQRWVEARLRDDLDAGHRRCFVVEVTRRARPEDRPLLQRLLDLRDDESRVAALRALDGLESGDAWLATLRAFATTAGLMGDVAHELLVRRGDADALARTVANAIDERPEARFTRARALCLLAGSPEATRAHRGLLEAGLSSLVYGHPPESAPWPVWTLARALVVAFGASARPALLRAYFTANYTLAADDLKELILERSLV